MTHRHQGLMFGFCVPVFGTGVFGTGEPLVVAGLSGIDCGVEPSGFVVGAPGATAGAFFFLLK